MTEITCTHTGCKNNKEGKCIAKEIKIDWFGSAYICYTCDE